MTPSLRLFFRLAIAITWALGGLGLVSNALRLLRGGFHGESCRFGALRRVAQRLIPPGPGIAIATAGYAAIVAAAWFLSGSPQLLWTIPLWQDTGPLGEEFGWRGFALPRLLRHVSLSLSPACLNNRFPSFCLRHR